MRKFLLALSAVFLFFQPEAFGAEWKKLEMGLFYRTVEFAKSKAPAPPYLVHAFRIDPKKYDFRPLVSFSAPSSVRRMAEASGALIAVNANFFDPAGNPLGLVVSQGRTLNPFRHISWWGVFYIENSKPYIVSSREFQMRPTIRTAVEVGPRLVSGGKLVPLKPETSPKTAVGVTRSGDVIILCTLFPLPVRELAGLMMRPEKKGGFDCLYALNFDGGSSSQMVAHVGSFELKLPSYIGVPVGLGVFRK